MKFKIMSFHCLTSFILGRDAAHGARWIGTVSAGVISHSSSTSHKIVDARRRGTTNERIRPFLLSPRIALNRPIQYELEFTITRDRHPRATCGFTSKMHYVARGVDDAATLSQVGESKNLAPNIRSRD